MEQRPWAAFCMSTYRRPQYLESQLRSLLTQTFTDFEIVVSDNDPGGSGEAVARAINDSRIKYFRNGENLGMITSFNKSIGRSSADFVVMVTDDDPVVPELLSEMKKLYNEDSSRSIYAGFSRSQQRADAIEVIEPIDFINEILNPSKTPWLLWSSCVIRRDVLLKNSGMPDYGSPHLADHALIAMAGSVGGGVIINKKFSSLTSHDSNFSKFNFDYYVNGCKGFYEEMNRFCEGNKVSLNSMKTVQRHLYHWLLGTMFNLKRYYTVISPDAEKLIQIDDCANKILSFPFMKGAIARFKLKSAIFHTKRLMGILSKNK